MTSVQHATISFRVRLNDLKEFERVAGVLCSQGRLKKRSVGVMAKLFLYVMTNQFKLLETLEPHIVQQQQIV
jgi:hypothetical protein